MDVNQVGKVFQMAQVNLNPRDLFNALKHGDADHQRWLKMALYDYFAGREITPVFGHSNKDLKIMELEARIEELTNGSSKA